MRFVGFLVLINRRSLAPQIGEESQRENKFSVYRVRSPCFNAMKFQFRSSFVVPYRFLFSLVAVAFYKPLENIFL